MVKESLKNGLLLSRQLILTQETRSFHVIFSAFHRFSHVSSAVGPLWADEQDP